MGRQLIDILAWEAAALPPKKNYPSCLQISRDGVSVLVVTLFCAGYL